MEFITDEGYLVNVCDFCDSDEEAEECVYCESYACKECLEESNLTCPECGVAKND